MPDRSLPYPAVRRPRLSALALGVVALLDLAAATTAVSRSRTAPRREHRAAPPRVHLDDLPPVHDAMAPGWTAAVALWPMPDEGWVARPARTEQRR